MGLTTTPYSLSLSLFHSFYLISSYFLFLSLLSWTSSSLSMFSHRRCRFVVGRKHFQQHFLSSISRFHYIYTYIYTTSSEEYHTHFILFPFCFHFFVNIISSYFRKKKKKWNWVLSGWGGYGWNKNDERCAEGVNVSHTISMLYVWVCIFHRFSIRPNTYPHPYTHTVEYYWWWIGDASKRKIFN